MTNIHTKLSQLRTLIGELEELGAGEEARQYLAEHLEIGECLVVVQEWLVLKERLNVLENRHGDMEKELASAYGQVAALSAVNGVLQSWLEATGTTGPPVPSEPQNEG